MNLWGLNYCYFLGLNFLLKIICIFAVKKK